MKTVHLSAPASEPEASATVTGFGAFYARLSGRSSRMSTTSPCGTSSTSVTSPPAAPVGQAPTPIPAVYQADGSISSNAQSGVPAGIYQANRSTQSSEQPGPPAIYQANGSVAGSEQWGAPAAVQPTAPTLPQAVPPPPLTLPTPPPSLSKQDAAPTDHGTETKRWRLLQKN